MVLTRVIPTLLLKGNSLIKTIRFSKYEYIGDPVNTVSIFNELEVDELCFLDIRATLEQREPNYQILHEISNECFMPLSYGGGIKSFEQVKKILGLGFEKIIVNTSAFQRPDFIRQIADHFGSQAVIGSIDVKKNIFRKHQVYSHSGTKNEKYDPVEWALEMERRGVGEVLLTSIDREGTWEGYDIELVKRISSTVKVPVIASGGAGSLDHLRAAVKLGGASALSVGSMVVFQGKGLGVLVNFPDKNELQTVIN